MHRILIIDDSEVLNSLVKDFLSNHGYEVLTACNAEDGYQILRTQPIHLILLDVQLPDMGGLDFCRHLRSQPETRKIPIIMITAMATQTPDKIQGFQAGADDYLNKPFELPELLERVRAIFRRAPSETVVPVEPNRRATDKPADLVSEAPTLLESASMLLFAPWDYPGQLPYPAVTVIFLLLLNSLLLIGVSLAPLSSVRPLMVCLASCLAWGILVSVLVVSSSLVGLSVPWGQGARLFSLASLPLLLKWMGADLVAGVTSLSPFYFTASPHLFWPSSPEWVNRIDLFELWSVILVGILLSKRKGYGPKKAAIVAGIVWIAAVGISLGIGHFGGRS